MPDIFDPIAWTVARRLGGGNSGGGSGLPSGSSPNQYLVTDGEGNAKWEDKLCWSESSEEVVLAECQPEPAGEYDGLVYFALDYIGLVDGETYIVNYNGKDYKTKATVFALDNSGSIVLGNLALGYDGKDTGEPFVLFDHPEHGCEVGQMGGSSAYTISIRKETETIHKLSGKYVEGMGWSEDDTVIAWDGNTDGLVSIAGPGSTVLYRVSDFIPTGDYRKSIHVATSNGYEADAPLGFGADGILAYADGLVFFVLRDNVTVEGFTFPNAGTYFSVQTVYDDAGNSERMYPAEVRVGGTIHLIDKKYLPVTTTFYLDPDKRYVYKDASLTEPPSENEVRAALSGGIILENLNAGFSAKVVSVVWDMGEDVCDIVYIDPEACEVRIAKNGALLDS